IEHAVLHLLYARFFTKATRDLGLHGIDEPFKRLLTQGMIVKDGAKMSKSLGNTVDPATIMDAHGPDTARHFILFAALPEKELDWNDDGVAASHRHLLKLWHLATKKPEGRNGPLNTLDKYVQSKLQRLIKAVTEHIEHFRLSLALASIIEHTNLLGRYAERGVHEAVHEAATTTLIKLTTPFTPHLAEELWEKTGNKGFVNEQPWPIPDEQLINPEAEAAMELQEQLATDIRTVMHLTKNDNPSSIKLIIAPPWKYGFAKRFKEELELTRNPGDIIKAVLSQETFKQHAQDISKLVPALIKDPSKLPGTLLEHDEELARIEEAADRLKEAFGCDVTVERAEDSRESKAKSAMPGKPGIVLT
ncbi:class I tRNA ligase family protein, partial [Candidatus Woesearchaeota archaeon]|nr:class I tRNA ligase family protein [Candidatus Woesearchaeota archaeon]